MTDRRIPPPIRSLFQIQNQETDNPADSQEITDRKGEAQRVVKRLATIIAEHQNASRGLDVTIGEKEILIVAAALRDHAQGGSGALKIDGDDPIYSHCLTRLFEELVEEPSNILYATPTGPSSTRYDSMNVPFWIECLDHLVDCAPAIGNQSF